MDVLVNGDWSPWSEWSGCPNTCGKSLRSRKRTCTNPIPKNNGRLCIGSEREEEPCPEIVCSGQSTHLSSWSGKISSLILINLFKVSDLDWDTCSKSCGGGTQKRRRTCLNNGNQCSECLEETRLCNELACPSERLILDKISMMVLRLIF